MAFDPLSWAIGYTLKKGLDRLLTHKSLASNLQKAFSQWAKNLPPEAHIYPDSDFAIIDSDADPAKQPSLCALRNTLLDNHIPTESQWLDALLEQWRLVPGTVEEPQKFFKLPEETARKHLTILAKALADECAKYDQLFKTGAIDLLHKANGKLDTIDGKVDVLLERVKSKPIPQGPIQDHDLQIHISSTRDRQRQLAQIMVLNTGLRPVLLDAWFVMWSDMSGSDSVRCERGVFPVRLQDHERAEFLVDISSHPVEQLQNLGVVDAEKRYWQANAEELRQFIQVAKLYQPSKINPPTNESTNPKPAPPAQQKKIKRNGNKNKAINADGSTIYVADGDIHTGIDPDTFLDRYDKKSEELVKAREKIKQLEEQLAKPSLETNIVSEISTPVPSSEAKELAKLITEDDGPYALALKAIAEGNSEKADELLDETQQILDNVQQAKDKAQAKIYLARMQNASYAGKPQDALPYCDKLRLRAGDDAIILNEMAVVYYENAMYQEAEPLMRRALEIDESSFGKDHPKVAIRINNLAALLKATNRLKEAEPLMRRALQIDESSFGKDHPHVAIDLNNLAQLLQATNRLEEAEPLMRRSLEIDEKSFGKDHPDVARDLNNLAALLQATNRLKQAEPLMRRALEIDEKSFGKDHPNVATDLNNLAQLLKATNRLKEAEQLMRRALEIDEKSFGPDHPNVATDLNNLAQLLQVTNQIKEAEPLMRRALDIDEKSFGSEHPDVARDLNNLAGLFLATNRKSEAKKLYERAVKIFEDSLGPS